MGQTYKITAHFFGPRQEQNRFFFGINPALTVGGFLVYGDTAQKDLLAVEQYFLAFGSDMSESDVVFDNFVALTQDNPVEFRILGRPQFGFGLDVEVCPALLSGLNGLFDFQFGNFEAQFHSCLRIAQRNIAFQLPVASFFQPQRIIVHKQFGQTYQKHVSGDASVIPPIEIDGGHVFGVTIVVYS